ncbi:protein-L-isoaspartate(D-aspartate) O-methyltransferase [Lipingzhangella halophila]|uniref:Protein-L-isoaspartate O-methyltransferase n=1 Tax=Lipingzhangella halophila TaxID=1783352 RepID=A0A7W7RKS7_9ACTN|nr:methyltransferase domain-containing protein [Lipingzhangella halophila]MBB4933398.1 protein-L-isoaspartate(D-aspartate) O-methyltransferase [Lipingzhangella halophila]
MTSDLVARIVESGDLSEQWTPTFERVPRENFIPEIIWDEERQAVHRADAPHRWNQLVCADAPVITQLDDGAETGPGYISSSASKPSIVAMMLEALDVAEGYRVLEVGTGTGWNAALLADRLGDERVTTVEVDPVLAEAARKALADAGYHPTVLCGDGMAGSPASAPYDRVIATAAVQRVPYAWVEQTRPGGRIVAPFGTAFHNGTLLRLTVHGDGSASGRFGGNVGFMWVRDQRTPHGAVEDRVRPEHDYTETTTEVHPYEPVADFDASFVVGLQVPDMKSTVVHDGEPAEGRFTVYLMDPDSGSWASWRVTPERVGGYRVRQHGPRMLFDELSAAYTWWQQTGRPAHTRLGLTMTAEGEHLLWVDEPGRVLSRG